MKKLSLLLVFVMLLVMVLAINTFAASKNVAAQADLELHDSNSNFLDGSKLTDGNYNTACSAGDGPKTWINYKFHYTKEKFPNGINVAKVRVILNSTGTNANVCEYDTLSKNDFTFYIRLYDASGNASIHNVEYKTSNNSTEFKDAEGNVLYTYFEIEFEIPKSGVYQVEVPVVNGKNKNVCLWEVEIYDYECVEEDDHIWTAATCEAPAVCKYCKATTGTTDANNHTSIQADDGNCTTPVKCTACDTEIVPAYIHRFSIDANTCLNDGCKESIFEDNIANLATISVNPNEVWWACKTELLVDGNWSTATFAPMNKGYGISSYSYIFNYAEAQYLTRFVVAVNGEKLNTPDGYKEAKTDAVKNVVIKLYNQVNGEKVLVYESERFNFTDGANEAVLELPYALQVTEAEFAFNTSASWGSSFVREIEIYKPKSIETNIASVGNPVAGGGEVWWAVGPEYIIDGDKSTATHSPKSNNFTYTFDYGKTLLLSKAIVVANGECRTEKKVGDSDASGPQNSNSIQNVIITLYNKSGQVVYESDRYEFTEGVTEIVIQFPYTYQASKVVATFNSTAAYGSSFVREIEIYKTVLPNFPEGGVELDEVDFDGCWKKIKLKDAIEEAIYNKPEEGNNRGGHYYAVDEDGNYILDENGNAIFLTGAPVGGNSNAYGSEMDGVKETGLGIYYEGQNNGIQYNFNNQYLIKDITITYRAYCLGPNDGYDLWVGKIVNGEEVWEQVASYTASEAGYSTVKFELGEDGEGVEGSMFRFYWRAGQTERLTPTLTEVDMTLYENRCDWTVNNVLSQVSCGYDAVAECECSRCGFEKTIVTAPATCEHNKVEITAAKAATCTDFGYNAVKQCTTCQKTFGGDRIAKSLGGHKQGTAATCTSKAICSVCNEEYGDVLAHTPDREASDCENDKICSVCKTVLEEKTGHNWVGPTCVAQKTCTNCGATEGEIGTHTEGTPATCTSKAICSVCNQEYGDFKHGELNNLKCSVCNKYVVTTLDELKSAMDKCSSTEKETIVLGADIKPGYGTNNFFEIVKPITLDFAGHTLEIGAYQNGIRLNHPECALISSGGTGTFNFVGNVAAVKLFNADTIQNININVKTITAGNPITGISIQLAKGATSAHVNSIKNVRIEGQGLTVGFETYQCGSNADLVINEMENVYINATYNGKTGKDFEIIGMTLQAPCGTFTNCTVTSAEEGVRFRASANWSMTGTFVNCQVTGSTHGLNMYSDGDISSTAVLAFKSDANTTFTCTSNPEKSFTAALNGAIDNIEVEISGVKMIAYIDGQFYGSFEEAYAVVPDGGTLQILADVELVDSLVINKKITLDLNKYTVSAPNGKAGDGVFHVIAGGELTITGNGTVNGICANKDGYHMAIFVNGGKVVIEGGRFTNVGENLTDDQYDLIYVKGGELVINGGTFIAQTPKWTLNLHDKTPGSIVVNGGSFYKYDPTASETEPGGPVNFVAGECYSINGDYYVIAQEHSYKSTVTAPTCTNQGYTTHICVCKDSYVDSYVDATGHAYDDANDTTCNNECGYVRVACIGETSYATFAEALEAAVAGDTIVLLAPVTVAENMTINKSNITITSTGDVFVVTSGTLTINGNITVNAGTSGVGSWCAIWANGGNVVINAGTYSVGGDSSSAEPNHQNDLIYTKNNGTVTINGGTFKYTEGVWTLNQNDTTGGAIVVSGGIFENFNPANAGTELDPTYSFLAPNACMVKVGNNYVVVNAHTEETIPAVDATCTTAGSTAGVKCSVCETVLTAPETVDALDHTPGKAVVEKEVPATPTTAGSYDEVVYCVTCKVELSRKSVTVEPTCKHANKEIIPEVLPAPSNNHTGKTEGLYCLDCETVVEEQVEFAADVTPDYNVFGIYSMSLTLAENISVNYRVDASSIYKNPYMVFIFEDKEYVVNEYVMDGGKFKFNFAETRPHKMTSNINAYVYAETENGYYYDNISKYSVMQYCVNQLKNNDADLTTLISNLLVYGAMTQKYENAQVSSDLLVTTIVSKDYTLTPTEFTEIPNGNKLIVEGKEPEGMEWWSTTLLMGSTTELLFRFIADDISKVTIKVEVDGHEDKYFTEKDFRVDGDKYVLSVDYLTSLQYGNDVSASFMVGDVECGTMTDSINSYLYRNVKKYSGTTRDLMEAIYIYGESVKEYQANKNN